MSRFVAAALFLLATPAWAQSQGTIRIAGRVHEMVSVRFHSDETVGAGVSGANRGADSELDYTLDLGNVSATRGDSAVRGGVVNLILRANTPYVLTATVTSQGFGTRADELQLSDIGFGMPTAAIAPSGERARSEGTQVLDARFDSDPLSAPVQEGEPVFAATLKDLEGGVPVLKGDRISYGGSLRSPNNGLVVSTRYAVIPQFFRGDTSFEATVVYTISSP